MTKEELEEKRNNLYQELANIQVKIESLKKEESNLRYAIYLLELRLKDF